jgi:hypothetical protein
MKNTLSVIGSILIVAFALPIANVTLTAQQTAPIPNNRSPINPATTNFVCSTFIETIIEDSDSPSSNDPSNITARPGRNLDTIALTIQGDELLVRSGADANNELPAERFRVFLNNESHLMALTANTQVITLLETIFVNKLEGLGIWVRSRTHPLFSKAPDAATSYMACRQ